ncbi:hypothetical protein B0H14DRAFT_2613928 [Mycena olivaceomarginata]|nr:hypothetical protein B0H14DRAFT_2613928 [Mycena olivaceomarginata]
MSASNDIIDHCQHLKKQDVPKNLQTTKKLVEKHSIDVPTPRSEVGQLGSVASDHLFVGVIERGKLERNQGFTQLVASGRAKNGKGSKDICQIKWIDRVLPPAASNVHGRPGNRHAVHRQCEHLCHRHRAVESLENILLNMVREAPVSLCINSGEDELVNYAMETDTFGCRHQIIVMTPEELKSTAFWSAALLGSLVLRLMTRVVALFAKSTGAWISWREWCLRASVTPYRTTFKSLAITAESVGAHMHYCSGVSAGRSTSREVFLHFKLHIFPPERSTVSEYGRHHVALRIPKRTLACLYNTQHTAQGHGYMMRDSRAGSVFAAPCLNPPRRQWRAFINGGL